jgi:hypothetical protein
MQKITYTIGVQGRFLRTVRTYKVHSHRLEILGDAGTLVMELTDGSEVHVPDIGRKTWRVYPDYAAEKQRVADIEGEIHQKAQAGAQALFQQQQVAALNAQRRVQMANPMG